jgi:hypothetical protein
MTTRELEISKAVLKYLHSLEFGQATALQIHAKAFGEIFGEPKPSATELDAVLNLCDEEKWITGMPSRFTRQIKWNINDRGEAALLEL